MDVSVWYKYIDTNLCLCLVAREPELTWTCLRQGPLVIIAAPKGLHCTPLSRVFILLTLTMRFLSLKGRTKECL